MTTYEITITNYDFDPDSTTNRMRKYVHVIATEAGSYTEAEAKAVKWADENINTSFTISPIKEMSIESVVRNKEEEGGIWYLCKCVYLVVEDITQKPKKYKLQYLVEAENSEKATKVCDKVLKDTVYGESSVVSVAETRICEYI